MRAALRSSEGQGCDYCHQYHCSMYSENIVDKITLPHRFLCGSMTKKVFKVEKKGNYNSLKGFFMFIGESPIHFSIFYSKIKAVV